MSWFVSSRALWALALRQRTCWFMRFLPGQAARQLPDQSTTLWMEPSPTGDTRRRGARRVEDGRGSLGLVWQRPEALEAFKKTSRPPSADAHAIVARLRSLRETRRRVPVPTTRAWMPI